ncbi:rhomboid family intramembrane serine protease GlpG [Psychromonas sp. RZ22]|uniref:rhomboid family intramembrane serine protease GlpG n=1 Tax=Psychromonas algarum TaxID=2555643 RepID=UPI0010674F86|nr:rhomboid family intramembrane serine protease GlpG [Psychromonas sp. RZ22]TEW54224.1 rhomboid family intramembrane serine protease GlpG [Psychromonas sp. RZ22]
MTVLYRFENLRIAQAFSDYLSSKKIINSIERSEFHHQIIIKNDSQLAQAEQELSEFLENPNQKKYLSASWQSGHIEENSSELADANANLLSNFKQHGGIITHSVFITCFVIYAMIALGLFEPMHSIFSFFTHQPFDYLQSWRFITPAFLHFSLLHIVFNLLWWWQLAGLVETHQGKQRLLLLFVFSAIASNLAQFFLVGPYFGGLSGAVYGLVGYCWLYGSLNKQSHVQLPNSMFIFLLGWLALGFVDLLPANVANYAHLVGLLAGLILATVCNKLRL